MDNINKQKKLPSDFPMLNTVDDCHHDGINEWGYNGFNLYHRFKSYPRPKWNLVKKVSFTPQRILLLAKLISKVSDE